MIVRLPSLQAVISPAAINSYRRERDKPSARAAASILYASRKSAAWAGAGVQSFFVLSGMVVSIQSLMDTRIECLVAVARATPQDSSGQVRSCLFCPH